MLCGILTNNGTSVTFQLNMNFYYFLSCYFSASMCYFGYVVSLVAMEKDAISLGANLCH